MFCNLILSLSLWAVLAPSTCKFCACLQKGVQPAEVVSVRVKKPGGAVRPTTVSEVLKQIKAYCKRGKLVDAHGKEIYFYRMAGCWGNPPADYQEILQRQSKELQKLRKHYHVIEMTCNPSGEQISE